MTGFKPAISARQAQPPHEHAHLFELHATVSGHMGFLWLAFGLIWLYGLSAPAQAIVIRHDVAEQQYLDFAAPFDAVGRITLANQARCTGSLVGPDTVLTAAHCVDGDSNGTLDYSLHAWGFRTGEDVGAGNYTNFSDISSVTIHNHWVSSAGLPQYDLAVLTLSSPILDIAPLSLTLDDPTGSTGTLVGYGLHGDGNNYYGTLDNKRRAAQNTIDAFTNAIVDFGIYGTWSPGWTYRADFDSPLSPLPSTLGSSEPLPLEGITAAGDSGSPLLHLISGSWQIAGILHGGANPYAPFFPNEYGDLSVWAPVVDPDNLQFLQANGISAAVVSTPSSLTMLLLGTLLYRRHKRKTGPALNKC